MEHDDFHEKYMKYKTKYILLSRKRCGNFFLAGVKFGYFYTLWSAVSNFFPHAILSIYYGP